MNYNLNTINSIVLVKLSSTAPSTSVTHKAASRRLAHQSGASSSAARVRATLVDRRGSAVGKASALVASTQAAIRNLALPCPSIEGASYVQARDVARIQVIFDDSTAKLLAIRRDIVSEWPSLIAAAKNNLGDLAAEIDWPEAEDFAGRFTVSLQWLGTPAPIAGTVLAGVSSEVAARVRASSERAISDDLLAAHGAPVRDLIAALAESVGQVRNGQRIRQERFDNIRAAADDIANKNWLALPELDVLVAALRESVEQVTDAASLTSAERSIAADRIAAAQRVAESTLAGLGL